MTKHYSGKEIQIIPPSRPLSNVTAAASTPVPLQHQQNPGGIVSGVVNRWVADSQARTYDAYKGRSVAQRGLVEADTALGRALIDNQRMRQEFSELPVILDADRNMRQLKRGEEINALMHQIAITESRRERERLYDAAEMLAARQTALDAEQRLEAQRLHGLRYHSLLWDQRIGECELQVEEQQAILAEQRRRNGRGEPSLDELQAMREELTADGADTTPIDLAIVRSMARQRRARG
jgi:hypothetical protein